MKIKFDNLRALSKPIQLSLALAVIAISIFSFTISNVYTETYEIERFSNASETIRSPITIEDTRETERRQREALQSVDDRYEISQEVTEERIEYITELFDAIASVHQPSDQDDNDDNSIERSTSEKLQELKQILSSEITDQVSDEVLLTLIAINDNEKEIAYELLTTSLQEIFNEGVQREQIESSVTQLNQRLQYSSMADEIKEALFEIGEFAIVENSFFSIEETMEAERQAIDNVEPAMIRAGEVIVREDQTITNEIYDKLTLVGLLNSDRNIFPILGLLIFTLLLTAVLAYSFVYYIDSAYLDMKRLFALVLIVVFTLAIMKFISFFSTDANQLYLLMPIATSSMLLRILYRERLALIFSIVFAILATIIFNGQIPGSLHLEAGIYMLFGQLCVIITLIGIKDRMAILKAVLATGVVNILVTLGFLFLSYESYQLIEILRYASYGFISAMLSGIVTIGVLPFFESILGILSDTKLLTLASPNHPLLRKILTEAPGTYHHSVMVANLSEAACEAIGANGLLARVASYYHDLGKTKQPHYFIENQMGMRNPHDYLSPKQSATIILAHPHDGARILKDHRLPREIIDVAEQHHGTSLLKYFYYKEKEHNKEVREEDYRYQGPLPQTKESAVISICDSVEAAVRSLDEPTKEKIDDFIQSIVQERLNDGQLDDSALTFKELRKIKQTIQETLNGIYHSRIQYPTNKKEDI
ncbi:HD family phosphohydrolase [Amphibacillus cookii]|uniref:HD family phosphohydrolase n=1 Tax=Amphibacillus cookii TaxID=767787 RepID=UPI00195BD3E5|nr:HDIG domain-containing metalloprotein [Amphibacillus cookii]MBM7543201.1 putative nucleotidyltransferase with HDIG domain [Amphibacillus cookii]